MIQFNDFFRFLQKKKQSNRAINSTDEKAQ